jgi:hypothetical protein
VSGPYYQPPRVSVDRWFSSEHGIGLAASSLTAVVAFHSVLLVVADWRSYRAAKAYADGSIRDPEDVDRAEFAVLVLWAGFPMTAGLTLVLFVVWLWRVRSNAELFCEAEHRHARGWVAGAWLCPIVNLWYPRQIVDDVIAASDRRTPPQAQRLGTVGTRLVRAWWLALVVAMALQLAAGRGLAGRLSVDGRLLTAVVSTLAAVCTCAAAALAVQVIDLVNRMQTARPWTPWWAATTAPPVHGPQSPDSRLPDRGSPGYRGRLGHSLSSHRHGR